MTPPVFFVDRALGKQFPNQLAAAGIRVERHAEHFDDVAPDVDWIAEVARRGWYAISKDKNIYVNPVELAVVLSSGLGFFVLRGASARHDELAANFISLYDRVERFVASNPRPFVASVTRSSGPRPGSVSVRRSKSDLPDILRQIGR